MSTPEARMSAPRTDKIEKVDNQKIADGVTYMYGGLGREDEPQVLKTLETAEKTEEVKSEPVLHSDTKHNAPVSIRPDYEVEGFGREYGDDGKVIEKKEVGTTEDTRFAAFEKKIATLEATIESLIAGKSVEKAETTKSPDDSKTEKAPAADTPKEEASPTMDTLYTEEGSGKESERDKASFFSRRAEHRAKKWSARAQRLTERAQDFSEKVASRNETDLERAKKLDGAIDKAFEGLDKGKKYVGKLLDWYDGLPRSTKLVLGPGLAVAGAFLPAVAAPIWLSMATKGALVLAGAIGGASMGRSAHNFTLKKLENTRFKGKTAKRVAMITGVGLGAMIGSARFLLPFVTDGSYGAGKVGGNFLFGSAATGTEVASAATGTAAEAATGSIDGAVELANHVDKTDFAGFGNSLSNPEVSNALNPNLTLNQLIENRIAQVDNMVSNIPETEFTAGYRDQIASLLDQAEHSTNSVDTANLILEAERMTEALHATAEVAGAADSLVADLESFGLAPELIDERMSDIYRALANGKIDLAADLIDINTAFAERAMSISAELDSLLHQIDDVDFGPTDNRMIEYFSGNINSLLEGGFNDEAERRLAELRSFVDIPGLPPEATDIRPGYVNQIYEPPVSATGDKPLFFNDKWHFSDGRVIPADAFPMPNVAEGITSTAPEAVASSVDTSLVVEKGSSWAKHGIWGGMQELMQEKKLFGEAMLQTGVKLEPNFQQSLIMAAHQALYNNEIGGSIGKSFNFMELFGKDVDIQRVGDGFRTIIPDKASIDPNALFSNERFIDAWKQVINDGPYSKLRDELGGNLDVLMDKIKELATAPKPTTGGIMA